MVWRYGSGHTETGTVLEWSPGPKGPSSGTIHGDDGEIYGASEDRLRDAADLPQMTKGLRVRFVPGRPEDGEKHIAKSIEILP